MPQYRKKTFTKTYFIPGILDIFSFGPFNLYTTLSLDPPSKEEKTEVWAGETTCYHH